MLGRGCEGMQQARRDAHKLPLVLMAEDPVHIVLATSDVHLEHKLLMTRDEVIERTQNIVAYAGRRVDEVEFCCEDASRTDPSFVVLVCRAAVDAGYEKAFSAILDGHVTTFISGLILAQYGTGPIKGFAVTLIVGILASLFTGVVCTRLVFDWWEQPPFGVFLGVLAGLALTGATDAARGSK